METAAQDATAPEPIRWYMRTAVDEYLEAAAARRSHLEATIVDANARIERAHIAAGLHRMMAMMMLDTQHELNERRRGAEAEAAAEIIAAEVEAARLVTEATTDGVAATGIDRDEDLDGAFGLAAEFDDGLVVDLTESRGVPKHDGEHDGPSEPRDGSAPERVSVAAMSHGLATPMFRDTEISEVDQGDDEFFEYLRGSFGDAGRPGPLAE